MPAPAFAFPSLFTRGCDSASCRSNNSFPWRCISIRFWISIMSILYDSTSASSTAMREIICCFFRSKSVLLPPPPLVGSGPFLPWSREEEGPARATSWACQVYSKTKSNYFISDGLLMGCEQGRTYIVWRDMITITVSKARHLVLAVKRLDYR